MYCILEGAHVWEGEGVLFVMGSNLWAMHKWVCYVGDAAMALVLFHMQRKFARFFPQFYLRRMGPERRAVNVAIVVTVGGGVKWNNTVCLSFP